MTKRIQIHNVPDALYRVLNDRAAKSGISFSDYMLSEIQEIAERPILADLRERLDGRTSGGVLSRPRRRRKS